MERLRARLLAAITTGGLGAVACGSAVVPASDANTTDARTADVPDSAPPANVCPSLSPGQMAVVRCYTHEQLVQNITQPPGRETIPDGGVMVPADAFDPNGCARASLVSNDCCNSPSAGPDVNAAGMCCYTFCPGACCGRPFEIDGLARVSSVTSRTDWLASTPHALATDTLDARTRESLRDAWLADALMEHASVASFARFTLEMLAVGAPADLVTLAQRAALDEVGHARACFALASRFAGEALGPGALALDGAMPSGLLADAVARAVREGCVGETLASAVASAQHDVARDHEARTALATIARDEGEHAALAWRFVSWALREGDACVHEAVVRAFESALAAHLTVREWTGVDAGAWHAHGRLTADAQCAVMQRALADVVAPCARELFARSPLPSSLAA